MCDEGRSGGELLLHITVNRKPLTPERSGAN